MNALRRVPGHNVDKLRQIVKGLKNNKAVGNDGIPSEVYKFVYIVCPSEVYKSILTADHDVNIPFRLYADW